MRTITDWNEGWICRRQTAGPDGYAPVTLPHTWNAKDGQDGGNDYDRGTYEYVKAFSKPVLPKGSRLFLEVPAAAMIAEVYLNGQKLIRHEGGFSAFRADLTDGLQQENVLVVTVDNSANDTVYPQMADFTFYGGLYRGVKLIAVPEQHFELLKDGSCGLKVTPRVNLETGIAKVAVESWQNAEEVTFTIIGETLQEDGTAAVLHVSQTVASVNGHAQAVFTIRGAHLWDGLADPYLYTVTAAIYETGEGGCACGEAGKGAVPGNSDVPEKSAVPEGAGPADEGGKLPKSPGEPPETPEPLDEVLVRIGIRDFSITSEGFFLNGRPYPLRGVSKHQDRAGVGNAVTKEMLSEDMALIKEIGANAVRLAHYQHPQEFYDLCDENGILVWAEIPYITKHMSAGAENVRSQMRELITQCYNHPCIICWGLSNEITASGSVTEELLEDHRKLNDLCHEMDPTRPTTMAHVFMLEIDSPLVAVPDTGAYNLYFGWYLGNLEQNDAFFDEYHAKFPDRAIGFSEYGADANPVFQTADPDSGDYTEEYQCVYHEHILNCIEERPYLWCTFVWNMFDFAADGRDEGGAHGVNQKGLVTMDRKLKKDTFYLYKAAWSLEPFVHVCGSRYVHRAEAVTQVKVYSNQPSVTLLVDGQEVDTKTGERVFVFECTISGEHTVTAIAGDCTDTIRIRKVEEPDESYFLQKEQVVNWFDREQIRSDCFSVEDRLGEMLAHPKAGAIVKRLIEQASKSRGDVAQAANNNENMMRMMSGMKLSALLKKAGDAISQEQVKVLNEMLQKIPKETSKEE